MTRINQSRSRVRAKDSRTVLQTSTGGDSCAEFNFLHFDEEDAPGFLVPAVRQYLGASDAPQPDHPLFLGGT